MPPIRVLNVAEKPSVVGVSRFPFYVLVAEPAVSPRSVFSPLVSALQDAPGR